MINRPTPPRKRRGLRLVIAVALAGAAAGGVYMYAGSLQSQMAAQQVAQAAMAAPQPAVNVFVAKADVPANVPLSADLFDLKSLPADAVAPGAVKTTDQLTGKVLASPITTGEQLSVNRLIDSNAQALKTFADQIPAGTRAMSLSFTELGGAAGLVVPGSHVDVLGVFKKDVLGKDESMIMVQDILVLAVAQSTAPDQLPLQPTAAASPTPAPAVPVPGAAAPKPTATP